MPSPISISNKPNHNDHINPANGTNGTPSHSRTTLAPPETTARGNSTTQSSRNSPEPAQLDQQGHYVGPASGASFLLRIQRKLRDQHPSPSSETSIFTFGDLPLPEFNPSLLILPPRAEADDMLRRYFEFASATHRFLHRPTVERWLEELYETQGAMREQATARSKTAVVFMVFAMASNFPVGSTGMVDPAPRYVGYPPSLITSSSLGNMMKPDN
jgi:hypothetical protein